MPFPTFDEIKKDPVFLTGVVVGIIGVGIALYGNFVKKSKAWTYGGVALAVGSFAVAFGSQYMPMPEDDGESTTTNYGGVVTSGVTSPM